MSVLALTLVSTMVLASTEESSPTQSAQEVPEGTTLQEVDTVVLLGVGLVPLFSRAPHEHVGVQHRFTPHLGVYGDIETYSLSWFAPSVQARAFLPLTDHVRLSAGAGVQVTLTETPWVSPTAHLGIQGEIGPVFLSLDAEPLHELSFAHEDGAFVAKGSASVGYAF
jgi:hypothetical protein